MNFIKGLGLEKLDGELRHVVSSTLESVNLYPTLCLISTVDCGELHQGLIGLGKLGGELRHIYRQTK